MPEDAPKAQLYDMEQDPGETKNLYHTNPEVVARLLEQLKDDVFSGRSTEGDKAKNDTDQIMLWKSERGNKSSPKKMESQKRNRKKEQ